MENTTNYTLKKPSQDDLYNISDHNENMDIVDTELHKVSVTAQNTEESLSNHTANKNNPHTVTKAQVGLGNADNTSDVNKPVSTAQKTAIDAVMSALTTHKQNTANPHSVTKAQVGLSNVNNTADSAKSVASAARLTTARTIALGGQLTGSASFNGTENISLNASYTLASSVDSRKGYVRFTN